MEDRSGIADSPIVTRGINIGSGNSCATKNSLYVCSFADISAASFNPEKTLEERSSIISRLSKIASSVVVPATNDSLFVISDPSVPLATPGFVVTIGILRDSS